jgi:hypothetical protein
MPRAPTPTVLITAVARLGPVPSARHPKTPAMAAGARKRAGAYREGRAEARVRGVGKRGSRKSEARRIRHPAGAGGGDRAAGGQTRRAPGRGRVCRSRKPPRLM